MIFLAYLASGAALMWIGINSTRNRFAAIVAALVLKPLGCALMSLLIASLVSIPLALLNGGRPLVGLATPAFIFGGAVALVSGVLWIAGGMKGFPVEAPATPT